MLLPLPTTQTKFVFQFAFADGYWRVIQTRRLIHACVKRNKTDASDAAAWLEAARCADIHPMWVKSVDADNSCGSFATVCTDWRFGDADSISARDIHDPTLDAGYLSRRRFQNINHLLGLWGSPYTQG